MFRYQVGDYQLVRWCTHQPWLTWMWDDAGTHGLITLISTIRLTLFETVRRGLVDGLRD